MAYDLKVDAGKFGTSRGAAECRRERVGPVRPPIETANTKSSGSSSRPSRLASRSSCTRCSRRSSRPDRVGGTRRRLRWLFGARVWTYHRQAGGSPGGLKSLPDRYLRRSIRGRVSRCGNVLCGWRAWPGQRPRRALFKLEEQGIDLGRLMDPHGLEFEHRWGHKFDDIPRNEFPAHRGAERLSKDLIDLPYRPRGRGDAPPRPPDANRVL